MDSLSDIARALVVSPKGILAADDSPKSNTEYFQRIGLESTADSRHGFRELLFTTPGIEQYLGGVILHDETIHQKIGDVSVPSYLAQKGIIPGIKVDGGLFPLEGAQGQSITKGLEDLTGKLPEYYALGARFAKWRAVVRVVSDHDVERAVEVNANLLAIYAITCQTHGFVPIVETEVLLDGSHSIEACAQTTKTFLTRLFWFLADCHVGNPGLVLKTSMVLPGKDAHMPISDEGIASATMSVLKETVPSTVAGVVFLSGGQTPDESTVRLSAIEKASEGAPWPLSFSFRRALQDEALAAWQGRDENRENAQRAFLGRLQNVSQARAF